jgi:hypothetical protein
VSEARSPRRRRSVAVAPALLDPAELPEDAPGRVALIAVEAPDDIVGTPGAAAASPPVVAAASPPVVAAASPPVVATSSILAAGEGWFVVAAAALVIVAIFVVGMLLTR